MIHLPIVYDGALRVNNTAICNNLDFTAHRGEESAISVFLQNMFGVTDVRDPRMEEELIFLSAGRLP